MIDATLAAAAIARTNGVQRRHDAGPIEPLKRAAKRHATDLLNGALAEGSRILDVGGETFYHADLAGHTVDVANLPDTDMHALSAEAVYDAALAMHVLEHSPFPLYVLHLLHRALVGGGLLYVAVPHPSPRICHQRFGHWTVMPPVMWRRLLEGAAFEIDLQETGKMGARADWVEERFLARRPA